MGNRPHVPIQRGRVTLPRQRPLSGRRPRYDLPYVDDGEIPAGGCWTGMVTCQLGVARCCRFRHTPGTCTASGREAPALP